MHVPGGQVRQCAAALVLVLDAHHLPRRRRAAGVDAGARLDLGLLVGTDHVVAGMQQLTLPAALVQTKDRAGALGEPAVGRKDPGLMLPRADRVLGQPACDRPADASQQPRLSTSR
jgi:hypothetical protein